MSEKDRGVNLFELGQKHFTAFKAEFAAYGLEADPELALHPGSGLLCYYNLADRQIYLSVPDLDGPLGKLQTLFLRSLLGCESHEELIRFFELLIPHVIAHEMAHHYRHRYGQFGDSLWQEEQVANKLAVAVVKHRLSPPEKAYAQKFLRRAIETLSAKMEAKNIAVDSYYSPLHALNVAGQIGVADFEKVELLKTLFNVSEEELLAGSGQLPAELLDRLEQRDDLIEAIDQQYTADQIKYIYYHVGWLYLDLTSRETEYVDEFARNYLKLALNLLPPIPGDPAPADRAIRACHRAYQETQPLSEVAGRYFYKRYRALLLARLQAAKLHIPAQTERLKREARLILESWSGGESDTLDYLSQLAPPALRPLFPHLIGEHIEPQPDLSADLPTDTDRRLWEHATRRTSDEAAANTLYRLGVLDRSDIYRPLPAGLMLELAHRFWQVNYRPGETVIWEGERNDDVYFLINGQLEVINTRNGQPERVNIIEPGQMFGEIAFFTEDARYATVRALEPSRCFVLTDADLQLVAYEHPAILMQMAGVLAKRLVELYERDRAEIV
ncbi:MAG: cyclic nucleotide-binding domain-containing protein [Chloroflexota bacterium]